MTELFEAIIAHYRSDLETVAEVQRVVIEGDLTGGYFTVGDGNGTTSPVAYDADMTALQAAYNEVYGAGVATAAGTLQNHTVTFAGDLTLDRVKMIAIDSGALAGVEGVTVEREVDGRGALMVLTTGIAREPVRLEMDYVSLGGIPGSTNPTYDNHILGDITLTFSVWSNKGGERAAIIANSLIHRFEDFDPELTRGSLTNVTLAAPPMLMPQNRKDEQGQTVTLVPVQIRFSVEVY